MRSLILIFHIPLLAAGLVSARAQADPSCPVPPELWDRPRSGRSLLELNAIKPCLNEMLREPSQRLRIHHGSRGEGVLQAEELRSWLAALAIDPARVDLVNDLQRSEEIVLEVASGRP